VGFEDDMLFELRQINASLALLTLPLRSQAIKAFDTEILKSQARRKMFHALDGKRNTTEAGKIVGITKQAASVTLNAMLNDETVRPFLLIRTEGTSQIVEPDWSKVYLWHLGRVEDRTNTQ
jgi:hypothetical protein